MSLDTSNFTVNDLHKACQTLADTANEIRKRLEEDEYAIMNSKLGLKETIHRSSEGFKNLEYGFIKFIPQKAKPILFSKLLSLWGVSGIYFPFTAEANINKDIPNFLMASVICHEQAHQLGFAREDEANFISFLACMNNPNYEFQYSGTMLAFMHTADALYSADKDAYRSVSESLSKEVRNDLRHNWDFWNSYKGKVSEIGDKVNDAYLKSNGQIEGVKSYGRMVDLLLAYLN